MPSARHSLTLAHSPDPDDAFMWWPITGKVDPPTEAAREHWSSGAIDHADAPAPALDTGGFRYAAFPADIEVLNRRAIESGDLDITALSARTYAEVAPRYIITACGASFGNGYGPKVVVRKDSKLRCDGCIRNQDPLIAVPGAKTTAFLLLSLLVGRPFRFVEMPFDKVIHAVARGEVEAGLVIHEGQLTFEAAGLRKITDLGAWWKESTGLPLPLGVNAVRRDLDERFGPGSLREVSDTLGRSVRYALEHRAEGIEHALRFAMANTGGGTITRDRVETFVSMYVNDRSVDMGDAGREAIRRLLEDGARAGLCPKPGRIETI